jgi:hypothetical protein
MEQAPVRRDGVWVNRAAAPEMSRPAMGRRGARPPPPGVLACRGVPDRRPSVGALVSLMAFVGKLFEAELGKPPSQHTSVCPGAPS